MQRKYALFVTGVGFLFAFLILLAITIAVDDEPPLLWVYFVFGVPFVQAATFTIYKSNRAQALFGVMILAVLGSVLAVDLVANVSTFGVLFVILSIASALLHMFYGFVVGDQRKAVNA